MPLTHFICPDNQQIDIGSCLAKCRIDHRCVSKPTILAILSGWREWNGKPSTTQLLNGTRLEYLKAKRNYATAPRSSAYSLLGTAHHIKLANMPGFQTETQVSEKGDLISGITDLLEDDEEQPGFHILTDYKTYGSFRVAKLLGIQSRDGFSTTEVYQRSGLWGKTGTPKRIKVFYRDSSKIEDFDEAMQQNHYRILLERQGYKISKMQLQITVRDGGLQIARDRGVDQTIYYPVPVRYVPDYDVEYYFQYKAEALIYSIANNEEPPECDDRESWEGLRCRRYCEVAEFCSRGQREKLLHGN